MSKVVGVIGGMGPEATLDYCARVLALTRGGREQDRIRMIIDNNPGVPDRNAAMAGEGPSPVPVLQAMARGLEAAGAQMLVMPCNAAHAYADEVRAATALPFVDIIEVTVAEVKTRWPEARRIGVLAASGCLDDRLYQDALEREGMAAVVPEGALMESFMAVLYRIKAGVTGQWEKQEMVAIADALIEAGAEVVIAGCTEVPLVLNAADLGVPLIGSTDALAQATIEAAVGEDELI